MSRFKDSLKDAVRQMAFRTSIDNLKKRGVQNVNVLGMDRIIALIEAAVHKSLRTRLATMERDAVADATKAEFLRLLRSNEDLQRQKSEIEQQKERAEEEIDQLRRDLATQQQELTLRLEQSAVEIANRYDGENARIAKMVSEVMRTLAASGELAVEDAEARVVELVMNIVSGEREEAEKARAALRDREVDLLQRRISKLNESLSQTEQKLQTVAAMKNVEGGISSVYREVQGVDGQDGQAGKKKELMAEIFQANLKLQKRGKVS
ncbi:MAG: hypothetical protein KDC98_06525 [Planctomycetes bacterium]|nr:hypothetical protein [Planctomycetota bacterium]